jgi:UPF0716 family protein affecting phage T7 exclusion
MPASESTPIGKLIWLVLLVVMTIAMGVYLVRSEFMSLRGASDARPVPAAQPAPPPA